MDDWGPCELKTLIAYFGVERPWGALSSGWFGSSSIWSSCAGSGYSTSWILFSVMD